MFGNSFFFSHNRLWTPGEISTALWLDASDVSTITKDGGNGVSEWRDKSGNGMHGTQDTDNNRPQYAHGTSVNFDGVNDSLLFPSGFLSGATAFFVAMVVSGPVQQNNAIWGPKTINSTGLELVYTQVVGWATLLRINGSNKIQTGLWSIDNTVTITAITASSTATAGWLNGSAVSAVNSSGIENYGLDYTGIYAMGSYSDGLGAFKAQMNMREFIILQSSISTADRQKLEGYLAHKWELTTNLLSNHPYKNFPPTI